MDTNNRSCEHKAQLSNDSHKLPGEKIVIPDHVEKLKFAYIAVCWQRQ